MEYHFKDIKKNLLSAIGEAEFIIYCAVAWITDFDIIDALISKSKEGVKIELVVNDDEAFLSKKKNFLPFIEAGGKLYLYPKGKGLMHNKFCVIDLNTVITGSFNWTYSAATIHEENIIIETNNIVMSKDFSRQFKKLKQASIVFQNVQQSANNDVGFYATVSSQAWFMPDTYSPDLIKWTKEEFGADSKKYINDWWYAIIHVADGDREGLFIIDCKDQIKIPEKVFGYWNGLFSNSENERFYNFVCLDPLLIKHTRQ